MRKVGLEKLRHSLPTSWFISAGVVALSGAVLPFLISPNMDDFARTATLASTLPQGLLSGLVFVAYGLVHMLILQVRPSTAASVFGFLHLGAALMEQATRTIAHVLRQQMIMETREAGSTAQTMALVHMSAAALFVVSLAFFIIAVSIALRTRSPIEEAF